MSPFWIVVIVAILASVGVWLWINSRPDPEEKRRQEKFFRDREDRRSARVSGANVTSPDTRRQPSSAAYALGRINRERVARGGPPLTLAQASQISAENPGMDTDGLLNFMIGYELGLPLSPMGWAGAVAGSSHRAERAAPTRTQPDSSQQDSSSFLVDVGSGGPSATSDFKTSDAASVSGSDYSTSYSDSSSSSGGSSSDGSSSSSSDSGSSSTSGGGDF